MTHILELHKKMKGIFIKLPSAQVIELVVAGGLDFAVIDLEHSQLSESTAIRLLEHACSLSFPALVRVPEVDRGLINRLLEAGARGVQLSTVRRARQLRALRDALLYPPAGKRSISLAHRGAEYGRIPLRAYLERQRDVRPWIVAQLETAETDDPLDEILEERPDVVFIGTTDLAVDLDLDNARVAARIEEIAVAAQAANVALGGFALNDPRVTFHIESSDLALLAQSVAALARRQA
jgi:2-keto-3-deoxy-L-rhamnonate aldolase RhmA